MNDHAVLLDRVREDIELLRRGVRSAAHRTVRDDGAKDSELEAVMQLLHNSSVMFRVLPEGHNHADVTYFIHPHIFRVLAALDGARFASDRTLYDWAHGRLFGYSEEAIGKFLEGK